MNELYRWMIAFGAMGLLLSASPVKAICADVAAPSGSLDILDIITIVNAVLNDDAADLQCDCDTACSVDECGVCGGDGIPEGTCDCDGNVDLGCGCGEAGPSGCDNQCGSTLSVDICGICGGNGQCPGDGCDVYAFPEFTEFDIPLASLPESTQMEPGLFMSDIRSIDAIDMDKDGDLDLVVAEGNTYYSADDTIAWLQNNGPGDFKEHTIYGAWSLETAYPVDLDQDGDIDVISGSGDLQWHENDGNQNFTFRDLPNYQDQPGVSHQGADANDIVTADLDGDGDLDIVVTHQVDVLWWLKNDGNQNFQGDASTMIAWGGNSQFIGGASSPEIDAPESVEAVDMNGDGHMDLVMASNYNNLLIWFKNDGTGTFSGQIIADDATSVSDTQTLDFDGDGDWDVLARGGWGDAAKITLYKNDGSLNFEPMPVNDGLNGPTAFSAADMDNDGDMDVAVSQEGAFEDCPMWDSWFCEMEGYEKTGNDLVWLENQGEGNFQTQLVSAGVDFRHVVAADFDDDCDVDLMAAGLNLDRYYDNGAGGLNANVILPSGCAAVAEPSFLELDIPLETLPEYTQMEDGVYATDIRAMVPVDMDADGDLDLVVADGNTGYTADDTISWIENKGDGSFADHTIYGEWSQNTALPVDLDGDGDIDVISDDGDPHWHENLGDQTFITHNLPRFQDLPGVNHYGMDANDIAVADLDGDGDLDIIYTLQSDVLWWMKNDGDENFIANGSTVIAWGGNCQCTSFMGTETSTPEVDAPESVDAADMDGDGDVDLVVTSSYTNQLLWFENDGSGGFTGHIIATEAASMTLTQTMDFDGDGDLDVLAKSGWDVNARITLYDNDGTQNFSGTTLDSTLADPRSFTAADVDNDGDTDVVVTQGGTVDCDAPPWSPMCWDAPTYDNDLVWLENKGDGNFEKQTIATDINYQHVTAGRVSGDCHLDVFAAGFNAVSLFEVE